MDSETIESAVHRTIAQRGIKDFTLEYSKVSSKGENYLGNIKRIKVHRGGDGEHLLSLILKTAPTIAEMPVNSYYNREVCAYTSVLPELCKYSKSLKLAEYCDGSDKDKEEYIILADLNNEGFSMRDKAEPLDFEHLKLIFAKLAEFHATSFALKRRDPETYSRLQSQVAADLTFGEQSEATMEGFVRNLLEAVKEPDHRERLMKFLESIMEVFYWYLSPETAAPYNVFAHGDCWSNNILFKYKDGKPSDLRLIDWQLLRLASPITDLLYIVYINTDRQLRTKHLSKLFDYYYDTLAHNLRNMDCNPDECYPKPIFDKHLKMLMRYGLAAALVNLPTLIINEDPSDKADAAVNFEELFNQPLTEACAERVDGVVRDFVEGGFLEYDDISSFEALTGLSLNKPS